MLGTCKQSNYSVIKSPATIASNLRPTGGRPASIILAGRKLQTAIVRVHRINQLCEHAKKA